MNSTCDVIRVNCDDLPLELFRSKFLEVGRPVIIERCLEKFPCSKWTSEYLVNRVGGNKVTVRGKTNAHDYKVGKAYTVRESTVEDYINDMKKKSKKSFSSYMAVQNISKCFPQLQEECELPGYVEKIHNGPFLWVGRQGHYEYCHFDPDASMLMMIEGRKQVRLYSCEHLQQLYPNPFGSKGKTIQSQVDCDSPDLEKFPLFKDAVCHFAVLEPGDMLFIPAFWWHQVTSLSNSVSMNAFFGDAGTDNYIRRIMREPVWNSFRYWILNIVEQNKTCTSFTRVLERLELCLNYFVLKQFHEDITPCHDEMRRLVDTITDYLQIKNLPKFQGDGGAHPPPLKIRGLRWR